MLCQFSFQNFKSYKEETTFDFQAAAIPEFSASLLGEEKSGRLLPVGVVYGPNGGGKSNLLQALSCLITTVVKPIHDLEKTREDIVIQQRAECEPFLFDDTSHDKPTEFQVYFRQGKNEYRYYLALKEDEVVSEALYWRAIGGRKTGTVFEREGSNITLGVSINKASINTSVNPKMPYLSFLAINYDIPVIAEVQKWFESCVIRNYANPVVDSTVMISKNDDVKKRIVQALNDMGIDLTGYRFDENEKQLYTQRTVNGKSYELRFMDESDGTQKLIAVLPVLLMALREGRLVIIDELDAKLHPKLLRYVIAMFKNPKINQNGAQLIFTSHDVTTMRNTVFRRDEIWFAAENDNHESEIYSLYEIRREDNERVNNTAAYDKQYLEGRYGADPYLRNMLTGGDWE
ncbi:MAG: AAA family ATPase [Gemmiger formicilis]|uniref:AAA family ATPase n=1 Tax=Gemmiger formicilis TaxID=745368 RepID=UPI003993882C